MKNIKYSIMLAIIIATFSNSCTNLDETVYSEVPVDKFGTDQDQVNALVGSIYKAISKTGIRTS
jgi:hypothetical protein